MSTKRDFFRCQHMSMVIVLSLRLPVWLFEIELPEKKDGAVDRILITDRHFGIDDQIQSNRLLTLDANQFKELYSKTEKVSKCEVSICRMNLKIIYESKPEFKLI